MADVHPTLSVAVIGSGPAALMAADRLTETGIQVEIFEKRPSLARKLYIAGSSGLNVTHGAPRSSFAAFYGDRSLFWESLFTQFGREQWLAFLNNLAMRTFLGTSQRYFVEDEKAVRLVRLWRERLSGRHVVFHTQMECVDFGVLRSRQIKVQFADGTERVFSAVCFALGGGSYEPQETPLRWPSMFTAKGVPFTEFGASNVGYQIDWTPEFLQEAEGRPLKNVILTSPVKGSHRGDIMITRYGLEGTPVYFVGSRGPMALDLKPDLTVGQMLAKCERGRKKLSPIRAIKKYLSLDPAAMALLYHGTPAEVAASLHELLGRVKAFPLVFGAPQPLTEAISSSGGISLDALTSGLMMKQYPGVFAAGEMLDWDAPTGGFLIQACVSQGYAAAEGIIEFLN